MMSIKKTNENIAPEKKSKDNFLNISKFDIHKNGSLVFSGLLNIIPSDRLQNLDTTDIVSNPKRNSVIVNSNSKELLNSHIENSADYVNFPIVKLIENLSDSNSDDNQIISIYNSKPANNFINSSSIINLNDFKTYKLKNVIEDSEQILEHVNPNTFADESTEIIESKAISNIIDINKNSNKLIIEISKPDTSENIKLIKKLNPEQVKDTTKSLVEVSHISDENVDIHSSNNKDLPKLSEPIIISTGNNSDNIFGQNELKLPELKNSKNEFDKKDLNSDKLIITIKDENLNLKSENNFSISKIPNNIKSATSDSLLELKPIINGKMQNGETLKIDETTSKAPISRKDASHISISDNPQIESSIKYIEIKSKNIPLKNEIINKELESSNQSQIRLNPEEKYAANDNPQSYDNMFSDAKSKSFNIKQVVESDEIIDDNSPINDDNNSDETTLFQKEFESDNKGKNNKSDGNNIFKTTEISPKSPKLPFIQLHKQEMPQFMTFSTVKLNKIPNMLNDIITGSNGNYSGTAKLILTPKTLGTIFVEINVHEDSVKMSIRADNHDTVKLIENSLGSLRDKIETNGVKIENLTINYYSGEHKKDTTSNRERRNDSGRRIKSDVFDIDKILFTKDTIDIKERNFQQGNYIEKYI